MSYYKLIDFGKKFNRGKYGSIGLIDLLQKNGFDIYKEDISKVEAKELKILVHKFGTYLEYYLICDKDNFLPIENYDIPNSVSRSQANPSYNEEPEIYTTNFLPELEKKYGLETLKIRNNDAIFLITNKKEFWKKSNWINKLEIEYIANLDHWNYIHICCATLGFSPLSATKANSYPPSFTDQAMEEFPYIEEVLYLKELVLGWGGNRKDYKFLPYQIMDRLLKMDKEIYPELSHQIFKRFSLDNNYYRLKNEYPSLAKAASLYSAQLNTNEAQKPKIDYIKHTAGKINSEIFSILICGVDPSELEFYKNNSYLPRHQKEIQDKFKEIYSIVHSWGFDDFYANDVLYWFEKALQEGYPRLIEMPQDLVLAIENKLKKRIEIAKPSNEYLEISDYPMLLKHFDLQIDRLNKTEYYPDIKITGSQEKLINNKSTEQIYDSEIIKIYEPDGEFYSPLLAAACWSWLNLQKDTPSGKKIQKKKIKEIIKNNTTFASFSDTQLEKIANVVLPDKSRKGGRPSNQK